MISQKTLLLVCFMLNAINLQASNQKQPSAELIAFANKHVKTQKAYHQYCAKINIIKEEYQREKERYWFNTVEQGKFLDIINLCTEEPLRINTTHESHGKTLIHLAADKIYESKDRSQGMNHLKL